MLRNCLEEDVCLYRPNARWGGEFEWPKTSRTTAGELQIIVESRGQKTFKKIVKQHLHHHMLFGRVSRKILLAHPKTNSSIFSYQTRLELQMGTGFYGQMKLKISFLAENTQDGFGEHRDKKYPMSTIKYTAVFLMLWAYISAGGPGHLFMDAVKYQQIKNQQVTDSVRKSYNAPCLDFPTGQ